jgi:epsilon-lactone hydrolase
MKLGSILKPVMQTFGSSRAGFYRDRFVVNTAMKSLFHLPAHIRRCLSTEKLTNCVATSIYPPEWDPKRSIVFMHGGAMCFSMIKFYIPIAYKLAVLTKSRVFLPDYRLAPEDPYPAGLDDCLESVRWVSGRWSPMGDIVLVGDSAGGNLALNSVVQYPDVKGVALLCPWLDLTHSSEYWEANNDDDVVFPSSARRAAWLYTQGGGDWSFGKDSPASVEAFEASIRTPGVSPLYADLSECSRVPFLIQASASERLVGDSLDLWRRLGGSVPPVSFNNGESSVTEKHNHHQISLWKNMPHVWQVTRMWTKEGHQALDDISQFINRL